MKMDKVIQKEQEKLEGIRIHGQTQKQLAIEESRTKEAIRFLRGKGYVVFKRPEKSVEDFMPRVKYCEFCQKTFVAETPHQWRTKRYCTPVCARKMYAQVKKARKEQKKMEEIYGFKGPGPFQVQIVPGAMISHDFGVFYWPECKWIDGQEKNQDLIFTATWTGSWWKCIRPGFGEIEGDYGNGSIFVHSKDGVVLVEEPDEEAGGD